MSVHLILTTLLEVFSVGETKVQECCVTYPRPYKIHTLFYLAAKGLGSFEHIKLSSKALLFFKRSFKVPHCLGTKGATSQDVIPLSALPAGPSTPFQHHVSKSQRFLQASTGPVKAGHPQPLHTLPLECLTHCVSGMWLLLPSSTASGAGVCTCLIHFYIPRPSNQTSSPQSHLLNERLRCSPQTQNSTGQNSKPHTLTPCEQKCPEHH